MTNAALDRALARVVAEIREGLRHGYFEYGLTCELIGEERRRLTLRAGKSHQFVIPKDECVRSTVPRRDSCDGSVSDDSLGDATDRPSDECAIGSGRHDRPVQSPMYPVDTERKVLDLSRVVHFVRILLEWDQRQRTMTHAESTEGSHEHAKNGASHVSGAVRARVEPRPGP